MSLAITVLVAGMFCVFWVNQKHHRRMVDYRDEHLARDDDQRKSKLKRRD